MKGVAVLFLALIGCAPEPPAPGEGETPRLEQILSLSGDPVEGRSEYLDHCSGCHGEEGQGRLGPELQSFLAGAIDRDVVDIVLNGKGRMSGVPDLMNDQEIADLVEYLFTDFPSAP